jgi:hypothetical protein
VYYLWRPACWVLKNVMFIAWARYKLRKHFRAAAAQTYRQGHKRARWWPLALRRGAPLGGLALGSGVAPEA